MVDVRTTCAQVNVRVKVSCSGLVIDTIGQLNGDFIVQLSVNPLSPNRDLSLSNNNGDSYENVT